ncbi:hypothetical protein L901_16775 [Agrobacterium sp. D14]|nr:hypothetical protein L901_16775 [Agrobacterium sp. D14]
MTMSEIAYTMASEALAFKRIEEQAAQGFMLGYSKINR